MCVREGETCDGTAVGFAQFSVGGRHACGLDGAGTAYCWGDNRTGQLGTGTDAPELARPTAIPGTWSTIAAGGAHTCALANGVAYCWGLNRDGQAIGTTGEAVRVPQKVQFGLATPPPFTKIVTGGNNTCALGMNQVFCWGDKRFIGVTGAPDIAVPLAGDNWLDVALGTDFGCGVTTEGIKCWGANDDAQAGMPASQNVAVPRLVSGFPPGEVTSLETGTNDACAVIGGALWCWGDARVLGGPTNTPTSPAQLGSETGWTRVAISESTMCGIRGGIAYCWGDTEAGETGAGLWSDRRERAAASVLGPADEIDMTTRHPDSGERSACLRAGTELRCWGDNTFGELGIGAASVFDKPVEVRPPDGHAWRHLTVGTQHACGTLDDGTLRCWGQNDTGAVSPTTARGRAIPCTTTECDATLPVAAPIESADEIVAGAEFTCARQGIAIRCWGDNRDNHLGAPGTGITSLTSPIGAFTKLLPGSTDATCAAIDSNQIVCWGWIGNVLRTMPTRETFVELHDITSVGLGERSACVLRSDGQRVCWGENQYGQLGNGNGTAVPTWTLDSMPLLLSIATRWEHSCAVTKTGQIACWGVNDREQNALDLIASPFVTEPTVVQNASMVPLDKCTAVDVSRWHSCAVCDGQVWCWGENGFGELGRGTREYTSRTPAPIAVDPALVFTEVGATEGGGCALTGTGRLFCWGDSWRGQVGTGASAKNLPTPVAGAL